jgi:hypothetical protein
MAVSKGYHSRPDLRSFTRSSDFIWLVSLGFLLTGLILFINSYNSWQWILLGGAIISQILIIKNWQETKYGSIVNVLIIAISITSIV